MNYQKRKILLSIWISISFVIAVIGITIIEYALLNNTYQDEFLIFWTKFSQAGNIITLIGVISTFLSLLTAILLPRLTKKESPEIESIKIKALTLTKIFAITIVCIALILAITDISLIAYIKNAIHKINIDNLMQLTYFRGVFGTIALYDFPIFVIIETILIFVATKKAKSETTK